MSVRIGAFVGAMIVSSVAEASVFACRRVAESRIELDWPSSSAQEIGTQNSGDLAGALELLEAQKGYRTQFEIRNLAIEPNEARSVAQRGDIPNSDRKATKVANATFAHAALGPAQSSEWRHVEGSATGMPGYVGSGKRVDWDGKSWCVFTPEVNGAIVSSVLPIGGSDEVIALANMEKAPSIFSDAGLAAFLRHAPNSERSVDGSRSRLTWLSTDGSGFSMTFESVPTLHVTELRRWHSSPTEGGNAGVIDTLTVVRLDDWRTSGVRNLPWLATYFTWRTTGLPGDLDGVTRLTEYRRLSLECVSLGGDDEAATDRGGLEFELQSLENGVDVIDQRVGAIYRIGEARMQLQGVDFELNGPLTQWRSLPELLPELIKPQPKESASKQELLQRTPPPEGGLQSSQINEASPLRGVSGHIFPPATADLGQSVKLLHVFELTNASSAPVTIVRVATSCGCAKCTPSSNCIAPGESVRVTVELDVASGGDKTERAWMLFADGLAHEVICAATVASRQARLLWPMCLRECAEEGNEDDARQESAECAYIVEVSNEHQPLALSVSSVRPQSVSEAGIASGARLEPMSSVILGEKCVEDGTMPVRWRKYRVVRERSPNAAASPVGTTRILAVLDGIPWIRSR